MKIDTRREGDQIFFEISESDAKYSSVFDLCFYEKGDGVYFKKFSVSYPYMDEVVRNFKSHGAIMFDQLGYFRPVPWQKALLAFCRRMEGQSIDWWLTGSCAACIRGIELDPHDVDIFVDSRDVSKMASLFRHELIEPIVDTKGWLTKDFGVIFLHARIDIATDPSAVLDDPVPLDCGPFAQEHLEAVQWEGYEILVPPVELQINANRRRGRKERVLKLEEYRQGVDVASVRSVFTGD